MFKLLIANIKMTFRDKQAIFWSLVFPLMFIIIFGLFDFTKMGDSKYVIFDQAQTELSASFQQGLDEIEFLKKQDTPSSLDEAKQQMTDGDIEIVLVVPEDFTLPSVPDTPQDIPEGMDVPPTDIPQPSPIQIYYDEGNLTTNQVALSVVDKFVDQMNMSLANTPRVFSYTTESIQSKDIDYIDIIMPGILGMAIMMSAIIGISTGISRYREQKLLKRLAATPIKIRDFLTAEVLSYLVVNLIQITLIILLARLAFNVQVHGNYFYIYLICIIGSIIFLNIGFAIAGYSKNTKTAEALSQVIAMPMMFFSGVFFSTETLPKAVASIVEYLPLTPMIDALREISINGGTLQDVWLELCFMGGWIIVSFIIAWKMFKFKD
ncbi:ABC transporter permease [Patescibacteria group bacterium]|nr:ABC transporter permease [Patescibacteria group bacterium]MBU0963511.1 ABC transporter permease [Patescibacteria group bacterium]